MISKDQSIVTQVAAKIASELTNTTPLADRNEQTVQALYLSHYDFVCEVLNTTHGFTNDTMPFLLETTSANTAPSAPSVPTQLEVAVSNVANAFPSAMYDASSGIQIRGTQHGPVPSWLTNACSKAGVKAVFDNRDTANAENRRPLFKAADGTMDKNGKPLAFWAPK